MAIRRQVHIIDRVHLDSFDGSGIQEAAAKPIGDIFVEGSQQTGLFYTFLAHFPEYAGLFLAGGDVRG